MLKVNNKSNKTTNNNVYISIGKRIYNIRSSIKDDCSILLHFYKDKMEVGIIETKKGSYLKKKLEEYNEGVDEYEDHEPNTNPFQRGIL